MRIAVPKETWPGELRAALVPQGVKKLAGLGFDIMVEAGLGIASGLPDSEYEAAGADVVHDIASAIVSSQIVLRVRKPTDDDVGLLSDGTVHMSFLDPFNERELVQALAERGVTTVAVEMVPRTTRAQKMDALSSQANLAGYVTVIEAASHCPKIFPMMMTPAGTIAPARVFVIGAGVAGLQAIATAKRLGARVEAFDTRPTVAEQVQSLGARFVNIDIGDVGETEAGYARELTDEQLAMQREGMKKIIAQADVVITTAQVFGRPGAAHRHPGHGRGHARGQCGGGHGGRVRRQRRGLGTRHEIGRDLTASRSSDSATCLRKWRATRARCTQRISRYFLDEFWDADDACARRSIPEDDIVQRLRTYARRHRSSTIPS